MTLCALAAETHQQPYISTGTEAMCCACRTPGLPTEQQKLLDQFQEKAVVPDPMDTLCKGSSAELYETKELTATDPDYPFAKGQLCLIEWALTP